MSGLILSHIIRVLFWQNISQLAALQGKSLVFLQFVKKNLGLKTLAIYSIPCECCQVYIG
jgi:hypothetical protein